MEDPNVKHVGKHNESAQAAQTRKSKEERHGRKQSLRVGLISSKLALIAQFKKPQLAHLKHQNISNPIYRILQNPTRASTRAAAMFKCSTYCRSARPSRRGLWIARVVRWQLAGVVLCKKDIMYR